MKVLKFGGTSVGSAENIRRVIDILSRKRAAGQEIAVVFSAMGGVTNQLIESGHRAAGGDESYLSLVSGVEEKHFAVVRTLIEVKAQSSVFAGIRSLFNELEDLLRGVFLIRELSPRTLDLVMSFGERLSTRLLYECIRLGGPVATDRPPDGHPARNRADAVYCDARELIKTDANFGTARVDFERTNRNIRDYFRENRGLVLITGFIASTDQGETTTLGRGGSDYTGSIFGAALGAEEIEIWTDVDGIMTADPRKVPDAFTLPTLSYVEAMEMSHFGAKVIHPPSLQPAFSTGIPIRILNSFDPSFGGTLISQRGQRNGFSITGISSIESIALVNVQGSGMVGVAGVSARLFTVLATHRISVILISQASSEHSICFAIDPKYADEVKRLVEGEFEAEIGARKIDQVLIEGDLSILAIVGENMKKTAGIAGKLFTSLGKNGINVVATAQGSSELNISVVINQSDLSKALRAVHEAFFLSNVRTLNLFIVGTGLIGGTLLRQIHAQRQYLQSEKAIRINVVGLANSRKMQFNPAGFGLTSWKEDLMASEQKTSLPGFLERMKANNLPNSVFVDCTSSQEVPHHYQAILDASISIVTPNKIANSSGYPEYLRLRKAALRHGVKFLYETNVGAGLPVINTLQGLINSGDTFLKIEAILSGTLSFIFNTFQRGKRFVDVVRLAKEKGYTEPDPRDDLSGTDVARKILILAREVGLPLELSDVQVQQILPDNCLKANTIADFFDELEKSDAVFDRMLVEAEAQGKVLRFIASLEDGKAVVQLHAVDQQHPFFFLSGSDNIISFTTERYRERPLVVKGPGAGAEVTATGVFADLISISTYFA
ncbi:MAG: bifunctional aspartate kinase/homoserine dehydrogenase I [Ferruginibacter sp.]|nr:bifunctional aspartate kinase/homoserine dehydrogenase I [Cytophagales bacterium]